MPVGAAQHLDDVRHCLVEEGELLLFSCWAASASELRLILDAALSM